MDILGIVVGLMGVMNLVMIGMLWVKVYSGGMGMREEWERMKREMKELELSFNREADRNILLLEEELRKGRGLLEDMEGCIGRFGGVKGREVKGRGVKGREVKRGVGVMKSGVQKAYEGVGRSEGRGWERIHGVARLIGEGKSDEEIGVAMGMSLLEVELCRVVLSNEVLGGEGSGGGSGGGGLIKRIIGQ